MSQTSHQFQPSKPLDTILKGGRKLQEKSRYMTSKPVSTERQDFSDESDDEKPSITIRAVKNEKSTGKGEQREKKLDVMAYFIPLETGGYQCRLCSKFLKCDKSSDTNLRKHLGTFEKMPQFLYPSQRKQHKTGKLARITTKRKLELDSALFECILLDGRSYNDFNKKGMRYFLKTALPGYTPPTGVMIQRRLGLLYREHSKQLRRFLSTVAES
ncbi:unnamed protein product [Didymodactylos carnosus]|uniref:BED-type domain-containing protein n=1 Tax=Didymodactylos carnosus TaxID=1234261 RepID=A0A8S2I619_9BILA|nr:unnamed protein product [Didymodactylos carnosus]CAF3709395.1 unnamed protein product [Didymodactylos carnosus]